MLMVEQLQRELHLKRTYAIQLEQSALEGGTHKFEP
jgi:hypothetical protein